MKNGSVVRLNSIELVKGGEELKIRIKEWLALSEAERFMKIYQAFTKTKGAQV